MLLLGLDDPLLMSNVFLMASSNPATPLESEPPPSSRAFGASSAARQRAATLDLLADLGRRLDSAGERLDRLEADAHPAAVFPTSFGAPCSACGRPRLSASSSLCAECECDRADEQGAA